MHLDSTGNIGSAVGYASGRCLLELVQRIPGPYRERSERL